MSGPDGRRHVAAGVLGQPLGEETPFYRESGHPAAADTMEATAAALRDSDKTLAKRLRRSAHKARARSHTG